MKDANKAPEWLETHMALPLQVGMTGPLALPPRLKLLKVKQATESIDSHTPPTGRALRSENRRRPLRA